MKKLTIGFPCYDDYDGIYFSAQALRMYHAEALKQCELLIVDNNPTSDQGQATKKFAHARGIKYVPFSDSTGPANTKNKVFEEATTDYVLCADSHVLFETGSLDKLLSYYNSNPDTPDLLQGPLVYDCLQSISTHFKEGWSGGMYGTWATDERGKDPDGEPFEIPMQGMGLFSATRKKWLKFNKNFYGFGAEEGYIHEKYRQAGHQTLCLPFLRWVHRFDRPSGVPYPLNLEDRVRNYFIGFKELGKDPQEIIAHFEKEAPHMDACLILKQLEDGGYSEKKIGTQPGDQWTIDKALPTAKGSSLTSCIKFNEPGFFRYLRLEFFSDAVVSRVALPPTPTDNKPYIFSVQGVGG